VGIGTTKVKETRTLLDHADNKIKEEIMKSEKTIHKA
jgi:hypothetical protein